MQRILQMMAVTGVLCVSLWARVTTAELYINEIFIDPPNPETAREYIELRGTPNMSLTDLWFVVLENEDTPDGTGAAGMIEQAIDLSGYSVGSNGFVVLRRATSSPYTIAPGTTIIEPPSKLLENSGATYMLINKGTGPTPLDGMQLDGMTDNDMDPSTPHDGLDHPQGREGWSILDSIGIFVEGTVPYPADAIQPGEALYGRTYAPINFGPEIPGRNYTWFDSSLGENVTVEFQPNITQDQTYVGVGFEVELIARYGNSTGSTEKDWHITNVTDNPATGYTLGNYRQAGSDPHAYPRDAWSLAEYMANNVIDGCDSACYQERYDIYLANFHESESSQYFPYGTNMTNTLGAANYSVGQTSLPWDYNGDGKVNAADYTVWRDSLGQADASPGTSPLAANADRDGFVDQDDYDAWKYHFGESVPMTVGGGGLAGVSLNAVPEPSIASLWLIAAILSGAARVGARRRDRWSGLQSK